VYCEAAFDGRYIHNFHVTWVKDREVAQGAGAQAAAAAGPVSGSLGPVKDNLPSDPITQVSGGPGWGRGQAACCLLELCWRVRSLLAGLVCCTRT
jgi:hypothetical protein